MWLLKMYNIMTGELPLTMSFYSNLLIDQLITLCYCQKFKSNLKFHVSRFNPPIPTLYPQRTINYSTGYCAGWCILPMRIRLLFKLKFLNIFFLSFELFIHCCYIHFMQFLFVYCNIIMLNFYSVLLAVVRIEIKNKKYSIWYIMNKLSFTK